MSDRPPILSYPALLHYSDRYQRDVSRCWADIDAALRGGTPVVRLVWQARTAYRACWRRELLRHREASL